MGPTSRRLTVTALAAAIAVFCAVQDRLTAHGTSRYVRMQRAALAGEGPPVTIDAVMRPAVGRSVRYGVMWGGAVLALGLAGARVHAQRSHRG